MGATSWRYYAPYEQDPESALQALRAEAFAQGEYSDPTGPLRDVLRRTARRLGQNPDGVEEKAFIDGAVRVQRAVRTGNMRGLGRGDQILVRRLRAVRQLAAQLGASSPAVQTGPASSIDELLERAAECGTHSILDIEHVSARPAFGRSAPMAATALQRSFGTTTPSRDQVEENWPDVAERLGPWHSRYLVTYCDGEAREYAFIGCSGD